MSKVLSPWMFLIRFFGVYLLFYALLLAWEPTIINNSIASIESGLLHLSGIVHTIHGNSIVVNAVPFEINSTCTGISSISMLLGLIFAVPRMKAKNRLYVFIVAASALIAFNMIRIYIVLWIALISAEFAETLHVVSWFIVAGLVLWLWYVATLKFEGEKSIMALLRV